MKSLQVKSNDEVSVRMSRDSIHVSMSAHLKRDNVRHRLDVLADRTGIPAATIAGRALMLGLALIEVDLTRLFPGGGKLPAKPSKKQ